MNFKVLINNVDYTKYVPIPFDFQKALDESLDLGTIRLCYLDSGKPFSPLDTILIQISDEFGNQKEYSFFIATDVVTEIISSNKYNHDLSLIEQTKWLERFTGVVKTNTTILVKNLKEVQKHIPVMIKSAVDNYEQELSVLGEYKTTANLTVVPYADYLKSPYTEGILLVPSFKQFLTDMSLYSQGIFDRVELLYEDELYQTINSETSNPQINISDKNGKWEIQYWFNGTGTDGKAQKQCLSISMGAYYLPQEIKDYSITDVVNNLLITIESLYEDETPRFSFNAEQSEEFSTMVAPDFSLVGTLWEALSEIGSYIHAIPRLHNNIIYFDKLGSSKHTEVDLSNYCSNTQQFDIEQFATAIDSRVDNIVNVDNKNQGSIVAPFNSGFKTVRAETGTVQLTTDNIIIETREPIEEIVSVECGYLSDGETLVGDITPYIFESAEYNALSSLGGEYPSSKGYALEYTQGQRNIKGLNFKLPNVISSVMSRFSIINIIARKLGVPAVNLANENIMNLQFRVKYIPIISTRVKQYKSNVEDIVYSSTLDFNQSANKINSVAYGENMKGTIAKLGNPEITKMYVFNDLSKMPEVGDLFDDDYYISLIKIEFYKEFYKCQIALSKNFNKLNEYVGIKSQKRFYEISERQSVDRYILFEDFCVIGRKATTDKKDMLTGKSMLKFIKQFTNAENEDTTTIDVVSAVGYSEIQNNLKKVVLPVNSLGIGNSLVFSFHYDDNFTAGNKRVSINNTELQYQVQYADIYGRIDKLDIAFGYGVSGIYDYGSAVNEGNILPIATEQLLEFDALFKNNNKIVIKKDNRENLYFTYQINFLTNDKSLVIGSALTRKSTFVSNELRDCKVYVLPNRINKFENIVDLTNATLIGSIDTFSSIPDSHHCSFKLPFIADGITGKSWVIVSGNELILGQNKNIQGDEQIDEVYFTFTHKII